MTTPRRLVLFAASVLCGLSAVARGATVQVGNASAVPGQHVEISVTVHADVDPVVAVEADLAFDAQHAPITVGDDRRPSCSPNPTIAKGATAFSFRPLGCDPGRTCTGMHAVVVAIDNEGWSAIDPRGLVISRERWGGGRETIVLDVSQAASKTVAPRTDVIAGRRPAQYDFTGR